MVYWLRSGRKEKQSTPPVGLLTLVSPITRDAFSILDTGVCGTVRFGDGSVVHIKGCGTIIFDCKNGEHLFFSGIYFIPKLKANMLDVGQLDEIGYEILMVNVYQGC
jgi:hypothetical protein